MHHNIRGNDTSHPIILARQGAQHTLRFPHANRAEVELWDAILARFPALIDDWPVPMLRVELSPDDLGRQRQVYLAPLLGGNGAYLIGSLAHGGAGGAAVKGLSAAGLEALLSPRRKEELQELAEEGVAEAVGRSGLAVSDWERSMLIKKLIEYSGPTSKWRVRGERRGGRLDVAAATSVGVSLTIDEDFDAWVGAVDAATAGGARGGEYAEKVRGALAKQLKIPVACIEVAGVHRGSILLDINLSAPPGDARTPMQLYEELSALVAASSQSLA